MMKSAQFARGVRQSLQIILLPWFAACGGYDAGKPRIVDPVVVPVARVTVTPSATVAVVGFTQPLAATTLDASGNVLTGRTVLWSSSDVTKATVNASGVVTGVAEGTVTVTATSEQQSGVASVQVVFIPVDSVDVTPTTATVVRGNTQQFVARTFSPTGLEFPNPVTWSSSDATKATVNASGLVAAIGVGSVTVTAMCQGKSASAVVTVVP